jgi:hypothetical protein
MVGLLILKHLRNVSDEGIVEQWRENVYYQYFCGMEEFHSYPPCASSDLVHFRKSIGATGIKLLATNFNFIRMMNKFKISFLQFFESIISSIFYLHKNLRTTPAPVFSKTSSF